MIYVECKPDKILVHVLTNKTPDEIEHCGGKSEVLNKLKITKESIGIIDEDPESLSLYQLIKNFKLIKHQHSLKLYSDENKNKIIVICPRLEDWIIEISIQEDIKLSNYNLPEDSNTFHKIINFNISKFQMLLQRLAKSKNERLSTLKEFIK